jgi:hypothetical protein
MQAHLHSAPVIGVMFSRLQGFVASNYVIIAGFAELLRGDSLEPAIQTNRVTAVGLDVKNGGLLIGTPNDDLSQTRTLDRHVPCAALQLELCRWPPCLGTSVIQGFTGFKRLGRAFSYRRRLCKVRGGRE